MIVVDCGFRCRFLSASQIRLLARLRHENLLFLLDFPAVARSKKKDVSTCHPWMDAVCGTYQFFFGFLLKVEKNHMCQMGIFYCESRSERRKTNKPGCCCNWQLIFFKILNRPRYHPPTSKTYTWFCRALLIDAMNVCLV